MDFFAGSDETAGELFERHFPGRNDVHRLLMEPISYANGSTLEDPAISYGIVFSNFMSQGVYTFSGGTDVLIAEMKAELRRNGVDLYNKVEVDRIRVEAGRAVGIEAHGRFVAANVVVSNANVKTTIEKLVGPEHFDDKFVAGVRAVRLNNSSTQVYMGIRAGETVPFVTDLLFTSTRPTFASPALCDMHGESRTFSFYYPKTRPGSDRYTIVSSTNANYRDWAELTDAQYAAEKQRLIEDRPCRGRDPAYVPVLHAAPERRFVRHQVRGPEVQPRALEPSVRSVPRRQRRHHHVGLARRRELRRDHRQQGRRSPSQLGRGPRVSDRAPTSNAASFAGEVAVVTGGTRGIGAAITRAFLAAGARVHAIYGSNEDAAQAFARSSGDAAERLTIARLDVADYAAVESFWRALDVREPNGVQILVNNAGIRRDAIVGTMKPEDWNQVIATNLSGSFYMSRFAVQSMLRQRYGRILFVTSPAAQFGFQGQANYAASKAGQIGLMRSLAREVAKKKITANCVSPGFIDTELLADLAPEVAASHLASVPLGRLGRPDEVAYAVLCLASREATYINGATLEVTGGL
jgi:NAD(P)-dependent dehydrogenase (short-subunit alcohol dehydrogenase family)